MDRDRRENEACIESTKINPLSTVKGLWAKVIQRAVIDLIHKHKTSHSAYNFIFNDSYTIIIDDYDVIVKCRCGTYREKASIHFKTECCKNCKTLVDDITIASDQGKVVEYHARDIIELVIGDDVETFREKVRTLIK